MNKYPQYGKQNNKFEKNNDKKEKFVRINWKIKNPYCRIIETGKPAKIISTREALDYAQKLGLDLVEIGYDKQNNCSNCKICDYGKFLYEQKQKEKLAKKQTRANQSELKCLQMSLTTDTADLERMINHAKEFLKNGDRVKISLKFRGKREMTNIELAKNTMRNVIIRFEGLAELDSQPQINGKEFSCILKKLSVKS